MVKYEQRGILSRMKVYKSRISLLLVTLLVLLCYCPLLFIPQEGFLPYVIAATICGGHLTRMSLSLLSY